MGTIIEVKNIVKRYDDIPVVNNLSFSVNEGEIFGFLGPNGAGKSTSINIMVGLLKANEGEILINNLPLSELEKKLIGICPQEITLWEYLTCYENLMMMGKMYNVSSKELKERIPLILEKLFLKDKMDEKISNLSGGMKRRMNIAMATIHNPKIIVLDEPSEGLDPQSRRLLWDYIKYQKKIGNTRILTTHLMDEADKLSDRIAIIDYGKLLKLDTPENLKKSIGEGDIVEFEVDTINDNIEKRLESIDEIKSIVISDNKITIRLLNSISKLQYILRILEEENLRIKDISIRQNTLEDVFIELTGRTLRE